MEFELTPPIAALTFLVVEDEKFQRKTLAWILAGLGAEKIYEAADGHEALLVIQDAQSPIDIVISDLDMPGMDGMEFIRHLGHARNEVPIILASALEPGLLATIIPMAEAYGINLLGIIEKPLTPDKLIRLITLYKKKNPSSAHTLVTEKFSLEELLMGMRHDEFIPYFQPKIELRTGLVCGAEALARWRHPDGHVVSPYHFIDMLESNGYIDEMTWIIVRKAVIACSMWVKEGIGADVSVNLSIKSFEDVKFADRLSQLVASCNVKPNRVVLELTESAATVDLGIALENLARLRMNGFRLSIDDYGKGYSSMQQLTRIAFTELKVDQAFITGASQKQSSRVILESSLDMAKRLGLVSVGEGVETREDLGLLCSLGCDLAQGYFIARPMEYKSWVAWTKAWDPAFAKCAERPLSVLQTCGD